MLRDTLRDNTNTEVSNSSHSSSILCLMFLKKDKGKNAVGSHVASLQLRGVLGVNTLTGFLAKKRFVRCA